jgi:hypothetical protein
MSILHQKLKLQFCFCESFSSIFVSYILHICGQKNDEILKNAQKATQNFVNSI